MVTWPLWEPTPFHWRRWHRRRWSLVHYAVVPMGGHVALCGVRIPSVTDVEMYIALWNPELMGPVCRRCKEKIDANK